MKKLCRKCQKKIPKRYLKDHERFHNLQVKNVWNKFLKEVRNEI